MGRHTPDRAGATEPAGSAPSSRRARRAGATTPRRGSRGLTGVVVVVVTLATVALTATALAAVGAREGWGRDTAAAGGPGDEAATVADPGPREGCERVGEVWVTTTDGLVAALDSLGGSALGPDEDGVCADLRVVGEPGAATAAGLSSGLDSPRRADVWVPDSSLWAARARASGVEVETVGNLGTSPVVVASSPAALAAAGWDVTAPTWGEVLGGQVPLAVPVLQDDSSAVMALSAARAAPGAGPEAAQLTVRAVLARQQVGSLSPSEGAAVAAAGGADAPVLVTSEQDVLRRSDGSEVAPLQAVAPRDGTPVLDFPVLAVPPVTARDATEEAAVRLVLAAVAGAPGQAAGAAAGLRGPEVRAVPGVVPLVRTAEPYVFPDAEAMAAVVADLERLAPPSQLLVVVDVSLSMSAGVGDGFTRVEVAADSLGRALGDLPDPTRVSLWYFASSMGDGTDHVEVLPSRRLDAQADGRSQRELLDEAVAALPSALVDGGTSLYDTTDAAMSAAREQWDPDTVSTVVLITDGRNEDSAGLQLEELQARLAEQADPARPVGLVAVAFGPDADLQSLQLLAGAAGGPSQAVAARTPESLRTLLVQLLAARTAPAA